MKIKGYTKLEIFLARSLVHQGCADCLGLHGCVYTRTKRKCINRVLEVCKREAE